MSANTYDELDPNVPCAWCGELVHCHKHDEHWCDKKAFQLGRKPASECGPSILADRDLAALRERVKVLEVALRKALRLMTWTDVDVENDKAKYGRLLDEIDAALAPTKEASRG